MEKRILEICLFWEYAMHQCFDTQNKIFTSKWDTSSNKYFIKTLFKKDVYNSQYIYIYIYSINRSKSGDYYTIINSNNIEFANKSNMLVKRLVIWTLSICYHYKLQSLTYIYIYTHVHNPRHFKLHNISTG